MVMAKDGMRGVLLRAETVHSGRRVVTHTTEIGAGTVTLEIPDPPAVGTTLTLSLSFPRLVRAVHVGDPTVVLARTPEAGQVRIAIASADPLPIDGRPLVVVEFSGPTPGVQPGLVRAVDAVVDERQVALSAE